jgi:UDP-galactopyranose mutase
MWKIESNKELNGEEWGWSELHPKKFPLKTGSRAIWAEAISAFPKSINGYDDYFEIATSNTDVHLNTEIEAYDMEKHRVKIDNQWHRYDIIVSTISPEVIMNNAFGPLRWVGRDFLKIVLPAKEVFPPNVYFLYYANEEPFTRIVEYKKFYQYESSTTLLILEVPSFNNKLYPYPTKKDRAQAQKYFDALPEGVYSIGRAGSYRYLDMDDIIQQCMDLVAKL